MGSALHFILLFSGLWALALCASRQFYVVNITMKWTEAQKYCQANYTDLATIQSEEEMDAVADVLQGSQEKFWIGLKQVDNKSFIGNGSNNKNRTWVWSDNTEVRYFYWNKGEPNNNETNFCVQILEESKNNTWNDAGCHYECKFVCYKKRIPLTVIKEKKTWREALRFCRQNHVDLVSVDSKEMQDWVEAATKKVPTDLWVGLRHTCVLGFWYWVSGERTCYQNWAPGYGTGAEDCSVVERTGALLAGSKKWVSLPQTDKLSFICITH